MNEFQAAMGLCVFDDLPIILANREKVFNNYLEAFKNFNIIQLQKPNEESTKNFAYFPVVFESEEQLLIVRDTLLQNNIFGRRYFYPSLESLTYLKNNQEMPNSSSISKRILCLPIYESLEINDQNRIIEIIKSKL